MIDFTLFKVPNVISNFIILFCKNPEFLNFIILVLLSNSADSGTLANGLLTSGKKPTYTPIKNTNIIHNVATKYLKGIEFLVNIGKTNTNVYIKQAFANKISINIIDIPKTELFVTGHHP